MTRTRTAALRLARLRHRSTRFGLAALLAAGSLLVAQRSHAQAAPAPSRWQSTLASFAAADRAHPPGADGVLFVGSSTIRMWNNLAEDFRQQPVIINRGFGGSTLADCQEHVRQLVVQYKPRHVLVYAGDNDLAEGRSPMQVRDSFEAFVNSVRADLPGTRISYISVKPSPLRAALLGKARETNALIASYVAAVPNAEFIDTFHAMLDGQGQPRAELFRADMLHLNDAGYRVWQGVIAAHLQRPGQHPPAAAQAGSAPTVPTQMAQK